MWEFCSVALGGALLHESWCLLRNYFGEEQLSVTAVFFTWETWKNIDRKRGSGFFFFFWQHHHQCELYFSLLWLPWKKNIIHVTSQDLQPSLGEAVEKKQNCFVSIPSSIEWHWWEMVFHSLCASRPSKKTGRDKIRAIHLFRSTQITKDARLQDGSNWKQLRPKHKSWIKPIIPLWTFKYLNLE